MTTRYVFHTGDKVMYKVHTRNPYLLMEIAEEVDTNDPHERVSVKYLTMPDKIVSPEVADLVLAIEKEDGSYEAVKAEPVDESIFESLSTEDYHKVPVPRDMARFLDQYKALDIDSLDTIIDAWLESPYWDEYMESKASEHLRWDYLLVDAVRKGYTISKVFDKDYMKEYYL